MRNVRVLASGLALALLLAAGLAFLGTPATQAQTSVPQAPPASQPNALAGKASYTQNCAPCHGSTGRGDGPTAPGLGVPPTAFADDNLASAKPLAEWFRITKNGNMQRMMPPWGNRLSDAEIWNTVAYAWSLHTSADEIALGKTVYEANCASCHGPEGKGKPPMLDLTDFARTSSISQNAWAGVVARGRGEMPGFEGKLTAAEQRAVLEYVRSLSLGPLFRGPLPKGTGVISGTIINGTTGQPVANLKVDLGIFDGSSLLETRSATTDAAGFYRFADLPTDAELVYASQVEYPAGIPAGSGPASFEAGKAEINLPISVFEVTDDPTGIRADRVHFIVEPADGFLQVAELIVFSLEGNRAYIGDGSGTLRFTLPPGAQDLEINEGELGGRYIPTPDGFVDTQPLPPGQGVAQVLFRYVLPYSGSAAVLQRSLPYPAANVNALIADVGATVTSEQLVNQGVRQTPAGNFVSLLGQNIPANRAITLRFSNLPGADAAGAPGAGAGGERAVLLALAGAAGAAAVALAAWPLLRRRAPAAGRSDGRADRESLLDALAELEIAHDAGRIPDAAYRDQRLRLKARLLDLMRQETR